MKQVKYKIYHHLSNIKFNELVKKIKDLLPKDLFIYDEKNPDLILVLGGDGSLLHFASSDDYNHKYLLINCGHLGYYADFNEEEFIEYISNNKINDLYYESLPIYSFNINKKDYYFINDVYILEEKPVDFELLINQRQISKIKANGLVIGTSCGSSGYLNSLNSPVIFNNDIGLQFGFIAPIQNKLNPLFISKGIVASDDIINIKYNKINKLFYDGIKIDNINNNEFKISKVNKTMQLAHFKLIDNIDRIKKTLC